MEVLDARGEGQLIEPSLALLLRFEIQGVALAAQTSDKRFRKPLSLPFSSLFRLTQPYSSQCLPNLQLWLG